MWRCEGHRIGQKADTETGTVCAAIETEGISGDCGELVPKNKHPSGLFWLTSPLVLLKVNCNAKFMLFKISLSIHAMHKTTIFIIQLCVVVELFSLKDACGFIAETASFYVTVESGVSMREVNIW